MSDEPSTKSTEESPYRIVRFKRAESEAHAIGCAWRFFDKATRLWFEWLGWMLITGAVAYVGQQTGDRVIKGLEVVSYILLAFYFQYFMMSLRFEPLETWLESRKTRWAKFLAFARMLTVTMSVVFGTRALVTYAIERLRDAAV